MYYIECFAGGTKYCGQVYLRTIRPCLGQLLARHLQLRRRMGVYQIQQQQCNVMAGKDEPPVVSQKSSFLLYPNPTNGKFTIERKGENTYNKVQVVIYGIHGEKLMTCELSGERKHEFNLSGYAYGLCFVKVVTGEHVETFKLVITR